MTADFINERIIREYILEYDELSEGTKKEISKKIYSLNSLFTYAQVRLEDKGIKADLQEKIIHFLNFLVLTKKIKQDNIRTLMDYLDRKKNQMYG